MRIAYKIRGCFLGYIQFFYICTSCSTVGKAWHWGDEVDTEAWCLYSGRKQTYPNSEFISNCSQCLVGNLGPSVVTAIPIIPSHCYWHGLATMLPPAQTERSEVSVKQQASRWGVGKFPATNRGIPFQKPLSINNCIILPWYREFLVLTGFYHLHSHLVVLSCYPIVWKGLRRELGQMQSCGCGGLRCISKVHSHKLPHITGKGKEVSILEWLIKTKVICHRVVAASNQYLSSRLLNQVLWGPGTVSYSWLYPHLQNSSRHKISTQATFGEMKYWHIQQDGWAVKTLCY